MNGDPVYGGPGTTTWYFNTPGYTDSLVLDVASAIAGDFSGTVALVDGSAPPLNGSYETGPAGANRLVVSGSLYVPEPATLGLLAIGAEQSETNIGC
jgi:hypothetical protein